SCRCRLEEGGARSSTRTPPVRAAAEWAMAARCMPRATISRRSSLCRLSPPSFSNWQTDESGANLARRVLVARGMAMETKRSQPLARDAMAYVLAGGRGSRLKELTVTRAKPAVYFGGKTRIIDFALSNALNSGIRRIGVATQYKAHSLI